MRTRARQKTLWRKDQNPTPQSKPGAEGNTSSHWCWCDKHKNACDGSCQFGWDDCPRCLAPFATSLDHNEAVCTYLPCQDPYDCSDVWDHFAYCNRIQSA